VYTEAEIQSQPLAKAIVMRQRHGSMHPGITTIIALAVVAVAT